MRVALDESPLVESTGGIRRYTVELTRALTERFPQDEFRLIGGGGRWWSYGLPRLLARHGFHLFHGTDFSVPYWPNRPSVLTLHDLSPWRAEGGGAASKRVRRRTPLLLRFGLATMVITPSEAVRREAIDFFGLAPEEVIAIPEAASEQFRPIQGPPPARPYFLHVGTLGPRKNIGVIQQAWRQLSRRYDVDLVFAGRGGPPAVEIPEDRLPALYAAATALLYPSLYEGFGLPVLEAMQSGTPVICSRDPALMELSSGACLHADSDWAAAMELLLTRPDIRAARAEAGLRRAAQFSWLKTAERTYQVYRTALRRFHG
ncbi:MAG: glycosyltransferase family 1 protein [Bryobacteraceae bacterium]|nr:glycosyltransferase family 1 protein [Bryobacteraceae bacterium]